MGARILIASDCPAVSHVECDVARHNYQTTVVGAGREVLQKYAAYDLILLDQDLPDLDAVSVSRIIRQQSDIPIIAFASADELDRVLLLETGCDDCIERPYRARELIARIKAVLRRTARPRRRDFVDPDEEPADSPTGGLAGERLVLESSARQAWLDGHLLTLSRKEYDLLDLLVSEPRRIFSRTELMTKVWDYPPGKRISAQASRTIDTHVSSLRRKLGSRDCITNVRGVGFRFESLTPVTARTASESV